MNIGTRFDYNKHVAFISTRTEIGTSREKAPIRCKWKWICWFGFFKRSGYFLPVFISDCKQAISTGLKLKFRRGLLVKHIQELAKPSHGCIGPRRFMLVGEDWQRLINCSLYFWYIMAYGSTPYIGMTPKKSGSHIKSYKWHARNVCIRSVNGLHEPYQALSSSSMGNRTINFAGKHH